MAGQEDAKFLSESGSVFVTPQKSTRRDYAGQAAGKPFICDWGSFAAVLVRRVALESIGSIDSKFFVYWSDADFFYRMKKAGWEMWCYPDVEIIHLEYYRPNRKRRPRSIRDFHMGVIRYYFKHHSAKGLNPVFWIGAPLLIFKMYLMLITNFLKSDHG